MKTRKFTSRLMAYLCFAMACMTLASCQTAQMQLAPSLVAVTPLTVEGANPRVWNSNISFGLWRTSQVREGLTWSFAHRLLGIDVRYAQQPYRIVMSSGAVQVQGECITRAMTLARNTLSVDPVFGRLPALSCGFTGVGEGTLRLHAGSMDGNGEIVFGSERWTIRSVDKFVGSPVRSSEPIGYELFNQGKIVAAVETINNGRVWISPALSTQEQARVAVLATVLLLYNPADADL